VGNKSIKENRMKIGREYKDEFHNFKYKVLGFNKDRMYIAEEDGTLSNLVTSSCKSDTLLPSSIEYLKGINQPFGTLDEDVQKALKSIDNGKNIEFYSNCFWEVLEDSPSWHPELSYSLVSDYIEKPAYVPRSFKETKVRVYNDELSKEVQEALFKLGYMWSGKGEDFAGGMEYLRIDNSHITWLDERGFQFDSNKEVQAHEILEEASKL